MRGRYIVKPDEKTNTGETCSVIQIPSYDIEFVFYDGVFEEIVKGVRR